MQEYTSRQQQIRRSAQQIYDVVSRFDNLTPALADRVEEWQADEDTCSFKAKGFNREAAHRQEKEAPKTTKIVGWRRRRTDGFRLLAATQRGGTLRHADAAGAAHRPEHDDAP